MSCSFATRTVTQLPLMAGTHYDQNAPVEAFCIVHGMPPLNTTIYAGTVCAVGAIEQATEKAIKQIEEAVEACKGK